MIGTALKSICDRKDLKAVTDHSKRNHINNRCGSHPGVKGW